MKILFYILFVCTILSAATEELKAMKCNLLFTQFNFVSSEHNPYASPDLSLLSFGLEGRLKNTTELLRDLQRAKQRQENYQAFERERNLELMKIVI